MLDVIIQNDARTLTRDGRRLVPIAYMLESFTLLYHQIVGRSL